MKVGERIRIFEVQNGYYEPKLIGKQFGERMDEYFGNEYGINLPYSLVTNDELYHHANIDNHIVETNHVKQVATMIVKSIKNEKH